MEATSKLMEKKIALEKGIKFNAEGRESYSTRNSLSRSKAEGQLTLPDVVTEFLKRAKVRALYEH